MFTGQSWLIAHDSVKHDLRVSLNNRRFFLFSDRIWSQIQFTNGFLLLLFFRRRSFHEPNLIHWIKYMKSSASESIRNAYFNFEQLSCSFCLAQPGISPLEWLWNGFDSDTELLNLVQLQLRLASIWSESIQPVQIIWVGLNLNEVQLMQKTASETGLRLLLWLNNLSFFGFLQNSWTWIAACVYKCSFFCLWISWFPDLFWC